MAKSFEDIIERHNALAEMARNISENIKLTRALNNPVELMSACRNTRRYFDKEEGKFFTEYFNLANPETDFHPQPLFHNIIDAFGENCPLYLRAREIMDLFHENAKGYLAGTEEFAAQLTAYIDIQRGLAGLFRKVESRQLTEDEYNHFMNTPIQELVNEYVLEPHLSE